VCQFILNGAQQVWPDIVHIISIAAFVVLLYKIHWQPNASVPVICMYLLTQSIISILKLVGRVRSYMIFMTDKLILWYDMCITSVLQIIEPYICIRPSDVTVTHIYLCKFPRLYDCCLSMTMQQYIFSSKFILFCSFLTSGWIFSTKPFEVKHLMFAFLWVIWYN
jgi:hypothetical protein